jgi:hypothetical protein
MGVDMAENQTQDQEKTESSKESSGGGGARTAVKAAAAAAATGAAAVAVRKVLSSSDGKSHGRSSSRNGHGADKSEGGAGSFLTSIASGGWDAARDALVPLAADAAGAAGTYLGKNGPEFVREQIVPRFISAFDEARDE